MSPNSAFRKAHRRSLLALASAAAILVLAAPAAADAATRYADDTGGSNTANDCTNQAAPCLTVQYAVDQAVAGETIELAAGTYSPGALIDKANLTINGAGRVATILSGTTALPRIFDLRGNADGLTIQNLRMLGPYTGAGTITDRTGVNVPATAGIDVAGLTLRNLDLTGLKYGIDVRYPGSATGWTIDAIDSRINEYGMRTQGATRNVSVSASHFDFNNFGLYVGHTGTTPRTPGVFDGIELADSSFNGNATKGLYFEQGSNMNLHGLSVVTPLPPSPRADVNPNNGIDLNVKYGNYANVQIADSVFSGATEAGLLIHGRNDGTLYSPVPGSLDNVDLERLTVTGNSATPVSSAGGINVSTATTNVSVTASRIVGNGSGGLVNWADPGPASTIDADDNWWGCNEGPTVDGSNACSATVQTPGLAVTDADPWLVLSASASPAAIAPDGATSDVTGALDTNSSGDPAGPPPDGPTVAFTTDLGSVAPAGDQLVSGEAFTVLTSGPTAGTAQVTASLDSAATAAAVEIVAPPVNTSPPVLSGDPVVGSELSCSLGDWSGDDLTYARQWLRDGVDIAGESAPTYTSAQADVGRAVSCRVTATNTVGASVSEESDEITVLPLPIPEPVPDPAVAATFTVDRTIRPRATANPVPIAVVTCLSSVSCKLSAPHTIKLRIKTRAYSLRVIAPNAFGAGETVAIGVRIQRPARRMLRIQMSRQLILKVKITAGGTTTPKTVRSTIRAKKVVGTVPSRG